MENPFIVITHIICKITLVCLLCWFDKGKNHATQAHTQEKTLMNDDIDRLRDTTSE